MGKDVKNAGILAFRVHGEIVFTGFVGHGVRSEHRTGRYAVDLDGLRWLLWGSGFPDLDLGLDEDARIVEALEALQPRIQCTGQTWGGVCVVPPEQVGIGIELASAELVCLPVCGGPGRHECPEHARDLGNTIKAGLHDSDWYDWLSRRTATEREELGAVVDGLRAILR